MKYIDIPHKTTILGTVLSTVHFYERVKDSEERKIIVCQLEEYIQSMVGNQHFSYFKSFREFIKNFKKERDLKPLQLELEKSISAMQGFGTEGLCD